MIEEIKNLKQTREKLKSFFPNLDNGLNKGKFNEAEVFFSESEFNEEYALLSVELMSKVDLSSTNDDGGTINISERDDDDEAYERLFTNGLDLELTQKYLIKFMNENKEFVFEKMADLMMSDIKSIKQEAINYLESL